MKMIAAVDRGDDFSFSLSEALYLIKAAWNAVTSATLANCFWKGGFFRDSSEPCAVLAFAASDDDQMLEHVEEKLRILRRILQEKRASGLDGFTAADFLYADEAVETSAELTTEYVVEQVQAYAVNDGDEDEEEQE